MATKATVLSENTTNGTVLKAGFENTPTEFFLHQILQQRDETLPEVILVLSF